MAKKALGPVRRTFAPWDDPSTKPFIEFNGVTKRFGDFTAIDNINLGIYEREFFALLGPSGCGKTTMMRMIAGFDEPSDGKLMLDGQDLAGIPPYRRPSNMMFQSYALFPHMTVAANVAFGLKQEGMPRAQIAARVDEMLKLVKLTPFAARKPHQLSGGQKQRVALARSLAKRPKVLLLDEPLGALDKKLREETQFELSDLQVDLGLTFVIVTHDQEEAMTLADRIAVMDHGRIVQIGTPAEIYEQPNSRYVADFIGSINLIGGRITACGGGAVRLERDGGTTILVEQDLDAKVGDTAWFAVRPEKITVTMERPAEVNVNCLEGEVWEIGYLGDISTYHVRLPDGETIKATLANRTRAVQRPIGWEDKVWVSWSRDSGVVLTS